MQKTRILGIAPYKGMENIMLALAGQRDDISLDAYVGDLDKGAELVSRHTQEHYDVIISRGGTARKIEAATSLPVIEVPISIYDVLRAIHLTEHYSGKYALVGFPEITNSAHILCDLLQYSIEIHTASHESEIPGILKELKEHKVDIVLCDTVTVQLAREMSLTPILITSGTESIEAALDAAVKLCQRDQFLQNRAIILQEALKNQSGETIILKRDGTIFYNTGKNRENQEIIAYLGTLLTSHDAKPFQKSFHLIENTLYSISLQIIHMEEEYYIFSVESNPVPQGSSKYGVLFLNLPKVKNQYFNSFYSLTSGALAIEPKIRQVNQASQPVMILGERGSGKDSVAAKLYIESKYTGHPYITINCELVNDKCWNYLIHHYNSPLCDNDNTIFISNIQSLTALQRKQLLTLMLDTGLPKRNRVILSCSQTLVDPLSDPARDFIDYLPCITLTLPPLRELSDDLTSSASLYLNNLNLDLSKEILGFEPEALTLLKAYSWPQNYMQLKRILAELVTLTDTSYIKADTVRQVIDKEKQQFPAPARPENGFDYTRTLEEMNQEIIHTVLARCNHNQSKAAKMLGIGRSTLWRYLK